MPLIIKIRYKISTFDKIEEKFRSRESDNENTGDGGEFGAGFSVDCDDNYVASPSSNYGTSEDCLLERFDSIICFKETELMSLN